jgi:hypothetical protein
MNFADRLKKHFVFYNTFKNALTITKTKFGGKSDIMKSVK